MQLGFSTGLSLQQDGWLFIRYLPKEHKNQNCAKYQRTAI
jgi:hypothetical protein